MVPSLMTSSSKHDDVESRGGSQVPWVDRVYLVDDHPFFATALAALINMEADLSVCGTSNDMVEALREVARTNPDVMILDVNMSAKNNWALPIELRKLCPTIPFLFVSSLQNPRAEMGLKWLEPCCFVEKAKDPAEIINAVRGALARLRRPQNFQPPSPPFPKT